MREGGREDVAIARRDGEDASYCTINNPVKLCVAKAGSAAAAAAAAPSSFLTPSSPLLPPPTPSSSSSAASSHLHYLSPSSSQPQREHERGQRRRYSCVAMLNVRIRPIHDSAAELRGAAPRRGNGAVTKACPHGQIRPFRRVRGGCGTGGNTVTGGLVSWRPLKSKHFCLERFKREESSQSMLVV